MQETKHVVFRYFVGFVYLGFLFVTYFISYVLDEPIMGEIPKCEPRLRYNFNHKYKKTKSSPLVFFFFSFPLTESLVS